MAEGIFGYNCLGLSITLTCPLFCADCITESGPNVHVEMCADEAIQYIHDSQGVIKHVSITGGEPMLNQSRIQAVIHEAKSLGLIVTVMTNGYWATDIKKTFDQLSQLKRLGLDMIGVSLDRFHLDFIEEQCCINIAKVGNQLNLPVAVRVIIRPGDDFGYYVKTLLADTSASVSVNYLVQLGRAKDLPNSAFKSCANPPRERCETVTAVDVLPGGNVYACCGPGLYMDQSNPLYLGNARNENLKRILVRGLSNPFMKVINTRGPNGLLEDLQKNGFSHLISLRSTYTDACQLCLDICNNRLAVQALQSVYAPKDAQRNLSAIQFLKMVRENKVAQQARKKI